MKRLLILAAILVGWANAASAAIFIDLIGRVQTSPGVWTWSYGLFLQPDEEFRVGDLATIYDFANPKSAQFGLSTNSDVLLPTPRTFEATIVPVPPGTGPNPFGTVPNVPGPGVDPKTDDDPAIPNVTVKMTGGADIVPTGPGPTTIGNLFVQTNTDAFRDDLYAAQAAKVLDHSTVGNGGFVSVPNPIPEPGSVALVLAGLIAVGAVSLRRRRLGD